MSARLEIRRIALCVASLAAVSVLLQACRSAHDNSSGYNVAGSGSSTSGGKQGARMGDPVHPPPPSSGLTLHAIELLRRPEDHVGKMIGLDGWSMSTPPYYGQVFYRRWPKDAAILGHYTGLRFNRMIADDRCLFDVYEFNEQGDFLQGQDRQFAGQIAVKMSSPGRIPDVFQLWDVEPLGTVEGTTEAGLVIRIPIVRFWHYHDSGLDADEPKTIVIPPQHFGGPDESTVKQSNLGNTVTQRDIEQQTIARTKMQYANSKKSLMGYSNDPRYSSYRKTILAFIKDADLIRMKSVPGFEPNSLTIRSGESDAAIYLSVANMDIHSATNGGRENLARFASERLRDLTARYEKTYASFKAYTRKPLVTDACGTTPDELANFVSNTNLQIEEAKKSIQGADPLEASLQEDHAEMLAGNVANYMLCYEIGMDKTKGAPNSQPSPERTSGGYKTGGLTVSAIENMTYVFGTGLNSRSIKYIDGKARSDTDTCGIDKNSIVYGDLHGITERAAVLVMGCGGGGSGDFRSLVAVWKANGTLVNSDEKELGDRIVVNSIAINNGIMTVDMLTQGPNDGMCCPTQRKILRLALQGNRLVDVP